MMQCFMVLMEIIKLPKGFIITKKIEKWMLGMRPYNWTLGAGSTTENQESSWFVGTKW